jgi:hypothetical protein
MEPTNRATEERMIDINRRSNLQITVDRRHHETLHWHQQFRESIDTTPKSFILQRHRVCNYRRQSFQTYQILHLTNSHLIVRWVLHGIYRVYFHPLHSFPGPKFSAFTRLPHLIATARGKLPRYVARLRDTHGAVVRISPDEISFIDCHAWRDIYGHGPKEGKGSAPPKNWNRYTKPIHGAPSLIVIQDPVSMPGRASS